MASANRKYAKPREKYRQDMNSPCTNSIDITADNNNDLLYVPRCLFIGTGGNVVVHMLNASGVAASQTYHNVPSGSILPICPSRVLATGTTASNIKALW